MKKILFVDFHNDAPHIQISFELAKRHLDQGDRVKFVFLGHDVPYREHSFLGRPEAWLFRRWMPEQRAARLVKHARFEFVPGASLPLANRQIDVPKTLDELKAFHYRGADLGMGVASSLISRTRNSRFDPSEDPVTVKNALVGSMAVFDYVTDLTQDYRPDRVYIFNGRLCHPRAALRAARRTCGDVRIHERGADMTRFVERSCTPHDRERIQDEMMHVWSEEGHTPAAEATAREWFEERREGNPRDWYSFTTLQVQTHLPSLPQDKRIVTYFSSSDDEIAAIGEEYRWVGWDDQLDAVRSLIGVMKEVPDSQLVIRLHPHLVIKHPDDLARWRAVARADDPVILVEPESPVDSYALLDVSDVVITGGSTIGVEAVYWGKPSILLGPSDYDRLAIVDRATSEERLLQLLREPSLPVRSKAALRYGYYRGTFGEKFQHYSAYSLAGGHFMGVDLHRLPTVPRSFNRTKELILGLVRRRRQPVVRRSFG